MFREQRRKTPATRNLSRSALSNYSISPGVATPHCANRNGDPPLTLSFLTARILVSDRSRNQRKTACVVVVCRLFAIVVNFRLLTNSVRTETPLFNDHRVIFVFVSLSVVGAFSKSLESVETHREGETCCRNSRVSTARRTGRN